MDVSTVEPSPYGLFGRRLHRLEAIATELSGLYRELAMTRSAEREAKAAIYLDLPPSMSHGERQARASHETVNMDSEVQQLNAQIQMLTEERDLLRLLVEFDVGA